VGGSWRKIETATSSASIEKSFRSFAFARSEAPRLAATAPAFRRPTADASTAVTS
jgi:hypothetical protein